MSSFRKGDQVSLTGVVQSAEGNYLMLTLQGAIDGSAPAMISKDGVSLLRASIHDGDEVEGGYVVHSSIPNTTLVLLQLIGADLNDPKSFSTASRDTLTLVRAAGEAGVVKDPVAAPVSKPEPLPAAATDAEKPSVPVVSASAEETGQASDLTPVAPVSTSGADADADADVAPAVPFDHSLADVDAPRPVSPLSADMVRRPEERSEENDAPRTSLADLGKVREESSPLKTAGGDELLLTEPLEQQEEAKD